MKAMLEDISVAAREQWRQEFGRHERGNEWEDETESESDG